MEYPEIGSYLEASYGVFSHAIPHDKEGKTMSEEVKQDTVMNRKDLLKSITQGLEKSRLEALKAAIKPKVVAINDAKAVIKRNAGEIADLLEEEGLDPNQVNELL